MKPFLTPQDPATKPSDHLTILYYTYPSARRLASSTTGLVTTSPVGTSDSAIPLGSGNCAVFDLVSYATHRFIVEDAGTLETPFTELRNKP